MQTQQKETAHVHVRWMIRRDMPEVFDIETFAVRQRWAEADFLKSMAERNVIGMVAERGEKVVGFMIYALHKSRFDLLKFAVHPAWRRLGVGSQMADKLAGKLSSYRRTRVTATVHEGDTGTLMFFKANGYRATGMIRGAFEDGDAIKMRFTLDSIENENPRR